MVKRDEILFVVRMEPLDRDATFEPRVVSEKDLTHAASAERGVDAVTAGEQIGHRRSDVNEVNDARIQVRPVIS